MRIDAVNLGNLKGKRLACIRLDLEQDFGDLLDRPKYDGLNCIDNLIEFIKAKRIPITCFVQGSIFEQYPDKIGKLALQDIEFGLHSYSHPKLKDTDLEFEITHGRKAFYNYFHQQPLGYSAPLGFTNESTFKLLARYNFKYDSSVTPSFRPGVFCNINKPLQPYLVNGNILEIPPGVLSNLIRVPLAVSYARLIGKPYYYLLKNSQLSDFVLLNFHLHDIFDLDSSKYLSFKELSLVYQIVFKRIYQRSKENGLLVLNQFVNILRQRGYSFIKMIDLYKAIPDIEEIGSK
ncbi:polysaccharide deacetylase family protein [Chloroflexota bacterium]